MEAQGQDGRAQREKERQGQLGLAPHSAESPLSSQQPLEETALELFSRAASGRNGIWAAVTS